MSSDLSPNLLSTLTSYLEGLEESGTVLVDLDSPFPASPDTQSTEAEPKPRQKTAPTPLVELPAKKSILPPSPQQTVVAEPTKEKLVWCTVVRKAECNDSKPATETSVVLVTGSEEMKNENGALLNQILNSAGYERLGKPLHFTHPEDLSGAGARILVMGNPALQAVSSSGMDLKIVRGMWQTTSFGKLISTLAPSVLEGNPAGKKAVWQDVKSLLKDLEIDVPVWTQKKLSKK